MKKLSKYCLPPDESMWTTLKGSRSWDISDDFLFQDNGSAVLAVAHADTVSNGIRGFTQFHDGSLIFSPTLDDRLGVYLLMEVLPAMGISMDVLLTQGEELCQSTAAEFPDYAPRDYNWIVGLDRAGADVVLYDYEKDEDWETALQSAGFRVGLGSYSDIVELEALGCSAVNVGIGYHSQHTPGCYCVTSELRAQLKRFRLFYEAFSDQRFVHTPHQHQSWSWTEESRYFRDDPYMDRFWVAVTNQQKPLKR